jgi:hypothetical protein
MTGKYTPGNCFILLFLLSLLAGCHSSLDKARSFRTIFDHYRVKEGITAIGFPPGLLSLALDQEDPEQGELKSLLRELSAFNMLIVDEGSQAPEWKEELSPVVVDFTSRNEFQDLFRMQAGDQDIFIRILEKEGMIREVILMMYADDGFSVIDLRGNISMEHFTRLVNGGHLHGLTSFSELDF